MYIRARVGRQGSCIFQGRGRAKEREENVPGGCCDCTSDMVSIGCGVISYALLISWIDVETIAATA